MRPLKMNNRTENYFRSLSSGWLHQGKQARTYILPITHDEPVPKTQLCCIVLIITLCFGGCIQPIAHALHLRHPVRVCSNVLFGRIQDCISSVSRLARVIGKRKQLYILVINEELRWVDYLHGMNSICIVVYISPR